MGREKECYREILVRLDNDFPGKPLFNQKELSDYLHLNPRTVKSMFGVGRKRMFITKEDVARILAM